MPVMASLICASSVSSMASVSSDADSASPSPPEHGADADTAPGTHPQGGSRVDGHLDNEVLADEVAAAEGEAADISDLGRTLWQNT